MFKNSDDRNREISSHILNGATTMVGVCITVIALFRAMKTGMVTYADELLSWNACIFIGAALLSYLSLRHNNSKRLERIADILFFTGMLIMLVVGMLIVYEAY